MSQSSPDHYPLVLIIANIIELLLWVRLFSKCFEFSHLILNNNPMTFYYSPHFTDEDQLSGLYEVMQLMNGSAGIPYEVVEVQSLRSSALFCTALI